MNTSIRENYSSSAESLDGKENGADEHTRGSFSSESNEAPRSQEREDAGIARAEDRAVFRIRVMVTTFLTLCTFGVAWLVYYGTTLQETDAFEADAYDFSTKVLAAMGDGLDQSFGAIDTFAISSVSTAAAINMTWPFVAIPNVGTKLAKVLSATKATLVSVIPRVTSEQVDEWNSFSLREGPIWVQENLRLQKKDPGFHGTQLEFEDYTLAPIFGYEGVGVANKTEFYPNWQAYPSSISILPPFNLDVSSALEINYGSKYAHISGVRNMGSDGDTYNFWLREVVGTHDPTEPVSEVQYPIFDNAMESVVLGDEGGHMVGFLFVTFYWRDYLIDVLPLGIEGIVVVVENTCNHSFTYQINGPNVEFQGFGDHHDHKFDHLRVSSTLDGLKDYSTGARFYTGLPLSDWGCEYTINIFPSEAFEDQYTTSNPWIYTTVAVAIFVFTSGVFAIYDIMVERRQKKVMSTGKNKDYSIETSARANGALSTYFSFFSCQIIRYCIFVVPIQYS